MGAASIAALLEYLGLSVTNQKLYTYSTVNPVALDPFRHGEVFVTDDSAETDLDCPWDAYIKS